MLRAARNIVAAVSLLLCLAIVTLWVRSYFVADAIGGAYEVPIGPRTAVRSAGIRSDSGGLIFGHGTLSGHDSNGTEPLHYSHGQPWPPPYYDTRFSFLGFIHAGDLPADAYTSSTTRIPFWFLALAFAAAPLTWVVRRHRRRRAADIGKCPTCGYDLRATPDRCPECGTVAKIASIK